MTTTATALQPVRLADNVYLLEAEGGNVAVCAGPEGALIVDVPRAAEVPRIVAAVTGLTPAPIRFLVNTHCHVDHVAGNAALGRSTAIVAHRQARTRLMAER